ncbi:hypothetical protein B0H17DRAFT_1031871 [Mycena rosella]|uniref:RNase H type-1 domain-containing protein n=1 Tax=Mycena rosella TaxID=1033263 RepID=A0AAD7MAF6_MYCRO|nr:hypothetical protein B0H17DRAFT_1031871 [Mycena rosella]
MLPAQLCIECDAMNTVAYYLSLPPSHPIRPLLGNAIAVAPKSLKNAWPPSVPACGQRLRKRKVPRAVGSEESPDTDFDETLGMEPIVPVYAAPWTTPLPVTTIILPKEDALRALEVVMADKRRRDATCFTDGSLLEGCAGGAAVRVEGGVEKECIGVSLGDGQVCEGEMEGLLCATTKVLRNRCHCVLCVADSQAALRGILSTKPRSGQFCAIRYDQLIRNAMLIIPHLTILNLWTPAHIGTDGNELADAAAKAATKCDPNPDNYVSLTSVHHHIHVLSLAEWDTRWQTVKTGKALRYLDRTPPSLIPSPLYSSSSLSRKASSCISQLRTGFTYLNANRYKSGFTDSPSCEACGALYETRTHYLLECPAWESLRQLLHAACRDIGHFGPLHLSPLLTHPKLLTPIGKFINATEHFAWPCPPPESTL